MLRAMMLAEGLKVLVRGRRAVRVDVTERIDERMGITQA